MAKKKNPLVFLDVSIDGDPIEKLVFELFYDVAPKTAENFRALCTGEEGIGPRSGKPLHYKGSFFHRISKGYLAQGGDFVNRDGTGGESIYGTKFPDELPKLKHDAPGLLCMPIADRDSLGSHFSITLSSDLNLDRTHVVFGKLVDGYEVLRKIESAGSEDGSPSVTVKIIYCGEYNEDNNKISYKARQKAKHRKSKDKKRKRRRYYSSSDSDSSSESESESSESDSDSDSNRSTSSYDSSSSDGRRKRRKRSSRKNKYKRERRRDKRRNKKRRRRDKRSKRKTKRSEISKDTDSESESEGTSKHKGLVVKGIDQKKEKESLFQTVSEQSPQNGERKNTPVHKKRREEDEVHNGEESPLENGEQRSNGIRADIEFNRTDDRQPDNLVNDNARKSRPRSLSPNRIPDKNMSVSPQRNQNKSPIRSMSKNSDLSRSPHALPKSISRSPARPSRSPVHDFNGSRDRSLRDRSFSGSPVRTRTQRSVSKNNDMYNFRSPRSPIRSPRGRSLSRSPKKSPSRNPIRSLSRSPIRSLSRSPIRSLSRSPIRSLSRSPRKPLGKSLSRSPIRAPQNQSRSPIRIARRSGSRIPSRDSLRRSISRSPKREANRNIRHSYSRSRSPVHKARSPPSDRGRSLSRSVSPFGSPNKRIRRGRGFSQQYSYARRYRTPSRSPVRSHRYSSRSERDRYTNYRRYSPRRYRSPPPKRRSPTRYRNRRSRSPSRSPVYRGRRYSRSRSRSPVRTRSPVEPLRSRGSPRVERRKSPSRSRSPVDSRSSFGSPLPRKIRNSRSLSRSSSGSPVGKKGLVSYGDGSPDSSPRG